MTKERKTLLALVIGILIVFGASFGIFYATQDANFYASLDGYIVAKADDNIHPYIKMSVANTAAWIYADTAPTALNAADRTVKELDLPISSQQLLDRIEVVREKKNVWITISIEGENPQQLKDILNAFSQNLFEDVAAASKTTLPLASFEYLRHPEIENRFPYDTVLLKSLAVAALFGLGYAAIAYGIPAYRKRKWHAWLEDDTTHTKVLTPQEPKSEADLLSPRLKKVLRRLPLQTLCILLSAFLLIYGGFHLFTPKQYDAKQLVSVSLLDDEIQTTEMVMESQEFLLSYYAHLTHPMVMRLFHQSLPHTLQESYSVEELIEMCEITHQEPTGIFTVTFTATAQARAQQLCNSFTEFAFSYLCDFLDLGEFKKVGLSPVVSKAKNAVDEIVSIVGAFACTFGFLCAVDYYDRRRSKTNPK